MSEVCYSNKMTGTVRASLTTALMTTVLLRNSLSVVG